MSDPARRDGGHQAAELALLVDSVADYAIFLLDPEGMVLTWNRGAQNIKGYAPEEIIGRHFSTFYTDADRVREHPRHELEQALASGRFEEEGWRVRKDGTEFWANVVITPVRDDGRLIGFGKVTRDLSERRRAGEALEEARRELERSNAELERFAIVAAHDLREPLITVDSFVQLLSETEWEQLSDDGRRMLGRVAEAVTGMQQLIEDLLLYARLGSATVEVGPVPLAPAIARVLGRLDAAIAARDARISVGVPAEAAVRVDRLGADIVLQNLVANAIKFGARESPRISVDAIREGDGWTLSVQDDGAGIAPADQARIFGAFERVRSAPATPGQGLGLSICLRVADRSGGRVGVESAPGAGSRFWCWLPAVDG